MKGTYYGEWLKLRGKKAVPHGCGLHAGDDKVVLGRLEQGKWIESKRRLIIDKRKKTC